MNEAILLTDVMTSKKNQYTAIFLFIVTLTTTTFLLLQPHLTNSRQVFTSYSG